MPTYVYQCTHCDEGFEDTKPVAARYDVICPRCGGSSVQILPQPLAGMHSFRPYYSPTFKQVVHSSKHKSRLMNEQGYEEYSNLDEVEREAKRAEAHEDEKYLNQRPTEEFLDKWAKAQAEHPS